MDLDQGFKWLILAYQDPQFLGLNPSSITSRKFFSKNRPSRSTRVGRMFRALSTRVGKPPVALIPLVNHVLIALT